MSKKKKLKKLLGLSRDDYLIGSAAAEEIYGARGHDKLKGGGGNDRIFGGSGTDTAVFSGNFAEYSFANILGKGLRGGLQVTHTSGSMADGSDFVASDVERIQFADRTIDLTINNAPIANADSNGSDLVIEKGGANNAIAGDSVATGNVLANDFDFEVVFGRQTISVTNANGSPFSGSTTLAGKYGTLLIDAGGGWTYTLNDDDARTQGLSGNEIGYDVFSYTITDKNRPATRVRDGASADGTLTITIQGRNDTPVISTISQTNLSEPADTSALTTTIAVEFNDVDLADTGHTASITNVAASGAIAGLALDAAALMALVTPGAVTKPSGVTAGSVSLTFSAASTAFDYLAAGEALTLTYSITINDGDGGVAHQSFLVTITGTNDQPQITAVDVIGAVTEDAAATLTDNGSITFTETDQTDIVSSAVALTTTTTTGPALPAALATALASALTLAQTGTNDGTVNWAFALDNNLVQYLANGETVTATYTITVTDDSGTANASRTQAVTVTITGTNDQPQITAVDVTGAVTEDAASTLIDSGSITFTETDQTDIVSSAVALTTTTTTGPALPAALATALASALTLAQTGTNDGTVNWAFALDNNLVQYLANGETVTATYIITVTDDSGTANASRTQPVTVTITGTNDQPQITAVDVTGAVTEDAAATLTESGSITFTETDQTDIVSSAVALTTTTTTGPALPAALATALASALTLAQTGTNDGTVNWAFALDNNLVQYLATGETVTATYTITVTDDSGTANASRTQAVIITIAGSGAAEIDLTWLSAAEGFIIQGDEANDLAGGAVASAGDVNGDGFDDLIIGAYNGDDGGTDAGEAYVVFGSGSGFGTNVGGRQVIDLTSLPAAQGFVIQGASSYDNAGFSVASAGDVNGDGFDDVIVGAPYGGSGNTGEAYVVFGSGSGFGTSVGGRQVMNLASLSATQGFIIQGASGANFAGWSVASGGDVNGDGFDDLIVGAIGFGTFTGEAFVVFGSGSGFGAPVGGRQVLDLKSLSAAQGFIIRGDTSQDLAGVSVSSAGDVNGDGFDDLIVGADGGDDGAPGAGEAYVVFGSGSGFGTPVTTAGFTRQVIELRSLTAAQGFIIQGDEGVDFAGRSVASAGDVNGDGFDDLIVGAWGGDDGGAFAGEAYVVFGSGNGFGTPVTTAGFTRQVIDLTSLSAAQGFIIQGDAGGDQAGWSVASAGDVNGDGFDDLIVGANRGDDRGNSAGEAYVVFGSGDGFGTPITTAGVTRQVIDLTSLSGAQGFVIQGDAVDDRAGVSVASAGDVNGDGFDDLIVGADGGDDGGTDAGETYVVFGAPFRASGTPVNISGTLSAEMLIGGLGADILSGGGGADIIRAGAGNDRIIVADTSFKRIDGGTGQDTLVLSGGGLTLNLTQPGQSSYITGIETIDISGSGDNTLILDAGDAFRFSEKFNSAFSGAMSHNALVIEGNAGDRLQLSLRGAENGSLWDRAASDVALDGTTPGDYDIFNLINGGDVLASVGVRSSIDVSIII